MAIQMLLPINGPILNDGELFTADMHFERLRRQITQAVMHRGILPFYGSSDGGGCVGGVYGLIVTEDGSHDAVIGIGWGYLLDDAAATIYESAIRWVNVPVPVTVPVDGPDGSDRVDLICIRTTWDATDNESRKYMDSGGVKSTQPMDTRETEDYETQVVKGTPGGGPPAYPSGWVVLAEFTVEVAGTVVINDTRTLLTQRIWGPGGFKWLADVNDKMAFKMLTPSPTGFALDLESVEAFEIQHDGATVYHAEWGDPMQHLFCGNGGIGHNMGSGEHTFLRIGGPLDWWLDATNDGTDDIFQLRRGTGVNTERVQVRQLSGATLLSIFTDSGEGGDTSATKKALLQFGDGDDDWQVEASEDGSGNKQLAFQDKNTQTERIVMREDGRIDTDMATENLTMLRKLSLAHAYGAGGAGLNLTEGQWEIDGTGQTIVLSMPEVFDPSDSDACIVEVVNAHILCNGSGSANYQLSFNMRRRVASAAASVEDTDSSSISSDGEFTITLGPGVAGAKNQERWLTLNLGSYTNGTLEILSVWIEYTMKRLPN